MIGAASGGYIADNYGRRMTFYVADVLMVIGSVLVIDR